MSKRLKIGLLLILFSFLYFCCLSKATIVFACDTRTVSQGGCLANSQTHDYRCDSLCSDCPGCGGSGGSTQSTSTFFGQISPPPGIANYAGGGVQGIVLFANNILKLIIVIGGIMTFLNILLAGVAFITAAGDPKRIEQAWTKIWQSILGLVIIAGSFVIAAIIGWVLFGNATAILSPKIYGPGQ